MRNTIKQRGSSLIVVLLVVIIVSLGLAASIRSTMVSGHVSMNTQMDLLMRNENDVALYHTVDRGRTIVSTSVLGLYGISRSNPNEEVVFCAPENMRDSLFSVVRYNTIRWFSGDAPNRVSSFGYCRADSDGDYATARKHTMTQISVRYNPDINPSDLTKGAIASGSVFIVTATTAMPKHAKKGVSSAAINTCFGLRMNGVQVIRSHQRGTAETRRSVAECLSNLGVPVRSSTKTMVWQ